MTNFILFTRHTQELFFIPNFIYPFFKKIISQLKEPEEDKMLTSVENCGRYIWIVLYCRQCIFFAFYLERM